METIQRASTAQETDETSPEPVQLTLPEMPPARPSVSYLPPKEVRLDLLGLLAEHREGLITNATGAMEELGELNKIFRFLRAMAVPGPNGPLKPSRIEVVLDAPDLSPGVPTPSS